MVMQSIYKLRDLEVEFQAFKKAVIENFFEEEAWELARKFIGMPRGDWETFPLSNKVIKFDKDKLTWDFKALNRSFQIRFLFKISKDLTTTAKIALYQITIKNEQQTEQYIGEDLMFTNDGLFKDDLGPQIANLSMSSLQAMIDHFSQIIAVRLMISDEKLF